LLEDVPLLCLRNGARSLTLRYQVRYRPRRKKSSADLASLDRHTRVPDLAIELRQPEHEPALWIFDAKYRLDTAGGVPEDALADAYTYRGSIGRPDGSSAVRAALLLYPGVGRAELYASGVGALPLLPHSNQSLHAWLQQALAE
jgi:large subunit ribosomal protein MRP49